MLNEELGTWKYIAGGFVEHEAEGTHIDTMARTLAGIEKLYVAVLIKAELQSLRCIVDFGRNHGIRHLQLWGKLLIDVQERGSLGEALGLIVVLTADL